MERVIVKYGRIFYIIMIAVLLFKLVNILIPSEIYGFKEISISICILAIVVFLTSCIIKSATHKFYEVKKFLQAALISLIGLFVIIIGYEFVTWEGIELIKYVINDILELSILGLFIIFRLATMHYFSQLAEIVDDTLGCVYEGGGE